MDNHIKICLNHAISKSGTLIRKVLDDDNTATKLVHALVTSRLDNGNTLLYGITDR